MTIVAEVRKDREDLARVLKRHTGIRRIIEDLYPDSAHFIYELLQNAEDVDATEVSFTLSKESLIFEHNGRPFDEKDIYAITDIGDGTKSDDVDRIGKFGIGFKAVFAYTESPKIYSPTYSFEIKDLVLPFEIKQYQTPSLKTRFEFPFNNSKKLSSDAHMEILSSFDELSPYSILFLNKITKIDFKAQNITSGELIRIKHPSNHIEIIKKVEGRNSQHYHFLRFIEKIPDLKRQFVAVAFELDFVKASNSFDPNLPLSDQFKIINANPGLVAISFVAEKEHSGLRFHIHAPFVTELSRASVKETAVNFPLIEQLADLVSNSLFHIRDLRLLNVDFLGVLPNPHDYIQQRYEIIEQKIVEIMNNKDLTPTHDKWYYPAKYLFHAKASFKNVIEDNDLEFIYEYNERPYKWAANIPQKNSNPDKFFASLNAQIFDIDDIFALFKTNEASDSIDSLHIQNWLKSKSNEWHQKFYAFLDTEVDVTQLPYLKNLFIIKLDDESYSNGQLIYFNSKNKQSTSFSRFVHEETYTSGKNINEQTSAKNFLTKMGVSEVGEFELIADILIQKYHDNKVFELDNLESHLDDIQKFIDFLSENPSYQSFFCRFGFLLNSHNAFCMSSDLILDSPYINSFLTYFYEDKISTNSLSNISDIYANSKIDKYKFTNFCKKIGVLHNISVEQTNISNNPHKSILHVHYNERWSNNYINIDWIIPGLEQALKKPSIELSLLIWKTLMHLNEEVFEAKFRPSKKFNLTQAPSQLACTLDNSSWIPQVDGNFVRPCDAIRDLLPGNFPYASDWPWLKAIRFGEETIKRSDEHKRKISLAKELGFEDDRILEDAKWFASLTTEERINFKNYYLEKLQTELPFKSSKNPDRRAAIVEENAINSPDRVTEERLRSINPNLSKVKSQTYPYLKNEYTNDDGVMICQICKQPLPFKLHNGEYYFEAVEILPKLTRHHYQNYIALCPNHAAMFKHANNPNNDIKSQIIHTQNNEIDVELANKKRCIFFTSNHINDMKSVIKSEI
ncbi:hypothetical protein SAMN04488082_11572 [Desulfomicrobium apsheronum]|uniref:Sacsin/Nov domain-containing protein n=1 Tax=Desulfomicrobium apsheronum TaxID=52560 RepID=A0A1I3X795_9BACT|nr:hypothetical protein [Desulfomicrobium apsheronum]SFK15169.1 hypothetical protein SAMN04488082_11572 [Desulfomicrobium apsheronum]